MIDRNSFSAGLGLVLLFVFVSGCSEKRPEGMPPLVPCAITVTQGGASLVDANVTMYPLDGSDWTVNGSTDKTGKAEMFTWGSHKGAPVGKYKVTVGKVETEKLPSRPSSEVSEDDPQAKSYNLVEAKYGMKDSTDLEIDVVKGTAVYPLQVGAPIRELIPPR